MTPQSEDDRYVEYLQRDICTPEWEEIFSPETWRRWYATNVSRLREMAESQGCPAGTFVREIERLANEFSPRTRFEVPYTSSIFEPLLDEVRRTAQALSLNPTRDVRIATSTDISVTPWARPTPAGEHLLFIGMGTSSYCNYWAKAFTAVVKTIAATRKTEPVSSIEDLQSRLRSDPRSLALPTRLALHYGFFGTTMGFGEVRQPADYLGYRLELLQAMEMFAVAHEYCHFIAEERLREMQGVELESFCDALALQISRNCVYPVDGWLAFVGIGPLVLFRSLQLCELAREQLIAARPDVFRPPICPLDGHPPLEHRISTIKALVIKNTAEDQCEAVRQFLEEYDRIAKGVIHIIDGVLESVIQAENSGSAA